MCYSNLISQYPFGMQMEGRAFASGAYRFGFNRQEKDDELMGEGNALSFKYRIENSRLGRFFSVDPLFRDFPWNSPYAFAENTVIWAMELEGLEAYKTNDGDVLGQVGNSNEVKEVELDDSPNAIPKERQVENLKCEIEKANSKDPEQAEQAIAMLNGVGKDPKAHNGVGVGQPGNWESIIPLWGSGRAAIDHYQKGNYLNGLGYTAIAISDVFLVKSISIGIGKGVWKLGSHSWGATRKWLGKNGYAESGQHVHHWAVHQKTAKKYSLEAVTNQPWNLMPMSSPAFHQAIHGVGPNAFGPMAQFWYGTPTWFKAGMISGSGRIID